MGLKIGSANSLCQSKATRPHTPSKATAPGKGGASSHGDRVSRLPRREAAASPTPNFGAWGQSSPPPGEKQLRLPKGMLLSDGSQGSKVKGLQYRLNRHGEELKKDGIFGPKTLESVRKFQQEQGLKVDGIVGPKTLKALNSPRRKAEAKPEAPAPRPEAKPQAPAPRPEAKPEAPAPRPEAKPEFGLSPKTLSSLTRSGKLEVLRKLPPEVSERLEKLPPKARETMFKQLSGSTWGNSHRDAFVNGKVMGMDTFAYMDDQMKAKVSEGKMSQREAEVLRADLQQLKKLSPKQRDAIAEMILLQQGK